MKCEFSSVSVSNYSSADHEQTGHRNSESRTKVELENDQIFQTQQPVQRQTIATIIRLNLSDFNISYVFD